MVLEANPDAAKQATKDGWLPLHLAARICSDVEVVRMVLEANPDAVNVADNHGKLPYNHRGIDMLQPTVAWWVLEAVWRRSVPHAALDRSLSTLTALALPDRGIDNAKCVLLCSSLVRACPALKELDLAANRIETAGCIALSNYIEASCSTILSLKIGGGDGHCLAEKSKALVEYEAAAEYSQNTVSELKEKCSTAGLSPSSLKEEIVKQLVEWSMHSSVPETTFGSEAVISAFKAKPKFVIDSLTVQRKGLDINTWSPLEINGHFTDATDAPGPVQDSRLAVLEKQLESIRSSIPLSEAEAQLKDMDQQLHRVDELIAASSTHGCLQQLHEEYKALQNHQEQIRRTPDKDDLLRDRAHCIGKVKQCFDNLSSETSRANSVLTSALNTLSADVPNMCTSTAQPVSMEITREDFTVMRDTISSAVQSAHTQLEHATQGEHTIQNLKAQLCKQGRQLIDLHSGATVTGNSCSVGLHVHSNEMALIRVLETEIQGLPQRWNSLTKALETVAAQVSTFVALPGTQFLRSLFTTNTQMLQTWQERYSRVITPHLDTSSTPDSRKRKAVDRLSTAASAVKKLRREFKHTLVDQQEITRDSGSTPAEIAEIEEATRSKRHKLSESVLQQHAAVSDVLTLVNDIFPELQEDLPELAQLKEEFFEGILKHEFDLYEPLQDLPTEAASSVNAAGMPTRCKRTLIYGEEVVLKSYPVVGGLKRMRKELAILARVNHEHVIKVRAVSESADMMTMYIELPFAVFGSVAQWARNTPHGEHERQALMRQALLGLAHLHTQGIIHKVLALHCTAWPSSSVIYVVHPVVLKNYMVQDLKPSNLLVMKQGLCCVSDFDVSSDTHAMDRTIAGHGLQVGTPSYMAPEVLSGAPHTVASDLYSLGVTMAELAAARLPAAHDLEQLAHGNWPFSVDPPPGLLQLLQGLLMPEVPLRWSAQQALESQYFLTVFPKTTVPVPPFWQADRGPTKLVGIIDAATLASLQECIRPPAGWYRNGADWKDPWPDNCTQLKLVNAWHIEDRGLWATYTHERARIESVIKQHGLALDDPGVDANFSAHCSSIPGLSDTVMSEVNEVLLLHGTKPDTVLPIIEHGLNERYAGSHAGSLFGAGNYFAHSTGKTDQYAQRDKGAGSHQLPLHSRLYKDTGVRQEDDVFYVFLCRVVLGKFCSTRTSDHGLFATKEQRELKEIPGTMEPFHSLVAKVCNHGVSTTGRCRHGCRLKRFPEFVSFHGSRAYPEYLIAYKRL